MADIKYKNRIKAEAGVNLSAETASRALTVGAGGNITSSATTDTELGYLSGTTSSVQDQLDGKQATGNYITALTGDVTASGPGSVAATIANAAVTNVKVATGIDAAKLADGSVSNTEFQYLNGVTSLIQDQLDDKINLTEKGANNGVATLDAGGKIPVAQLPSAVMTYEGTWNASTNTPTLANGVGDAGMVYLTSVAGSTDFGAGSITFAVGDWAVYNGSIWEKSTNSNSVVSVNSQTGVVVLDSDDISEGATNLYFSDARAQAAITGGASTIVTADLTASRALASDGSGKVAVSAVTSTELGYVSGVTSAIQTQLNGKEPTITTLSIAKGGTNSGTALNNDRIIVSSAGAIVEAAALADGELLIGSTGAAPVAAAITAGSGISVTNGAGSITIAATGGVSGDIGLTSFSAANNVSSAANVTGLAFANGTVRSFKAQVSVVVDATADLFETFELMGIQKGSSWDMSVSSVGDDSGYVFSITTAGQVQYTNGNYSGFSSSTVKFRATVTTV